MSGDDDLDALLQEDPESPRRNDRRPSVPERQGLSHFGPRQGDFLSNIYFQQEIFCHKNGIYCRSHIV